MRPISILMTFKREPTWALILKLSLLSMIVLGPPSFASTAGGAIQGTLFDPTGGAVTNSSVNFKVQILDKDGVCVLYEETHPALDLSQTNGDFSFDLGYGTSSQNNVTGGSTLDENVFRNDVNVTPSANCPSGVAVMSGDARLVHVQFDVGSGYTPLVPDMRIQGGAYASVAQTIQGRTPANFIQVVDDGTTALNQSNTSNIFSVANYAKLLALLADTSPSYQSTTPTSAINENGQRLANVGTPTMATDAATRGYADANVGGKTVDVSAVGTAAGNGDTLVWSAAQNKWVASSLAISGTAGGDLTGSYPSPTIAANAITSAKINNSGGGINRLLITDTMTGATVGYAVCTLNQIMAWTASGWACTNPATLAPVTSVAGKSGAVTLNAADIAGLGSAALMNYGTSAGQLVALNGTAQLPALDGSLLTGVNATKLQGRAIASTGPNNGQLLGWNSVSTQWEPTSVNASLSFPLLANPIGSATAPAYSFNGNTNSGMYSPGVGTAAFATNGTARLTIDGNGYVGIGTTTPNLSLDVNGNSRATNVYAIGQFWKQSASFAVSPAYSSNVDQQTGMFLPGSGVVAFSSVGSETLRIAATGNVGVGTSTPAGRLDVFGTGPQSAILVPRDTLANRPTGVNGMIRYNTSGNAIEAFTNGSWQSLAAGSGVGTVQSIVTSTGLLGGTITSNGTISVDAGTTSLQIVRENANAQIAQSSGNAANPAYAFATDTTSGLFSSGNGTAAFATHGTSRLTIDGTGNIGINTSNPVALLDLEGSANAQLQVGSTNSGGTAIQINNSTAGANNYQFFVTGSSNSPGHFGVYNATNPNTPLAVISSTSNAYVKTGATGVFGFSNFSNDATKPIDTGLSKISAGVIAIGTGSQGDVSGTLIAANVGVGTSAPAATLDVYGTGAKSAMLVPRDTALNRPSGVNGMIRYNTSGNVIEAFTNGSWQSLAAGSGVGTVQSIVASTGLLGGTITSNGTISVNAGTAPLQVVRENSNAQIAQSPGGATLPAYSFATDATTGLFSSGIGTAAFATNGTTRLTLDGSGFVGVGTSAPTSMLHLLEGDILIDDTAGVAHGLNLKRNGSLVGGINTNSFAMNVLSYNGADLNLGGPSAFITIKSTTPYTGVGTGSPQATLDVFGTGSQSAILIPRDTASNRPAGVNGMIRYNTSGNVIEAFTNGLWQSLAAGSSVGTVQSIVASTGLLGGTITANGTISVNAGTAPLQIVQENASSQITQNGGAVGAPAYSFANSTSTGIYSSGPGTASFATNGTSRFTIDGAGNFGFNTSAPIHNFDIEASDIGLNVPDYALVNIGEHFNIQHYYGAYAINLNAKAGSFYTNLYPYQASSQMLMSALGDLSLNVAAPIASGVTLPFVTGLMIKNNGLVGIGTSSPTAGLEVYGLGTAASSLLVPRDTASNRPTGINGMLRYNTSANSFEFFQNNAWVSYNTSSAGALSFPLLASPQTAAPGAPSYSFSGNSNTGLFSPATNQIALATAGTTAMTILASGNVGIGTASPSQSLEISGTGLSSGSNAEFAIKNTTTGNWVAGIYNDYGQGRIFATDANGGGAVSLGQANSSQPNYLNLGTGLSISSTSLAKSTVDVNGNMSVGTYATVTGAPANGMIVSGSVGIGTTAPQAQFDVVATGTTSAIIIPRDTAANRPTGVNGMLRYNTSANSFEFFQNNAWVSYNTGSAGALSFPLLASPQTAAPGAPSYSFTGNSNTGLFSPATNQLALATAGTTAMTIAPNGNVGIGSTAPNTVLDLISAAQVTPTITGRFSGSGGTGQIDLYEAYTGNMNLRTNYATSSINFMTYGTNKRMTIDYTGNVGVGTTSPAMALDVYATGAQSAMLVPRDSTTNRPTGVNGMLRYNTSASSFEFFQNNAWVSYNTGSAGATFPLLASPQITTPSAPSYSFSGNANTGIFSPATNQVAISTAGTTALTVLANGNVGIGTSAPGKKFEITQSVTPASGVDSSLNMRLFNTDASGSGSTPSITGIGFGNSSTRQAIVGGTYGNDFLDFYTSGSLATPKVRIDANGNVGLGTISPQGSLDIEKTDTNTTNGMYMNFAPNFTGNSGAYLIGNYDTVNLNTNYNLTGWVWGQIGRVQTTAGNTGSISNMMGLMGNVYHNGNQNITGGLIGLQADADNLGTGTVTESVGVTTYTRNSVGGTITAASGIKSNVYNQGTGTITTANGLLTTITNTGSGTITNAYGLSIGPIAGINHWSLYASDASSPSYFAGNVGVGTAAPMALLDVYGTGATSAIIVPRDITANRPTGVNGMIRYNSSNNGFEAFVNGAWMQIQMQTPAGTASVTMSGPTNSNSTFAPTSTTCNYSPSFGNCANVTNNNWPANGTNVVSSSSCVSLPNASGDSVVLDLGSAKAINQVYASYINNTNFQLGVSFSADNITYTSSTYFPLAPGYGSSSTYTNLTLSSTTSARYIRLTNLAGGTSSAEVLCQFAAGP